MSSNGLQQDSAPAALAGSAQHRTKKLLFAGLMIVGTFLAIEAVSWLVIYAYTGRPFSYQQTAAAQLQALQGPFSSDDRAERRKLRQSRSVLGPLSIHPYLGFVYDPDRMNPNFLESEGFGINEWGFVDDQGPFHKRADDKLIVAIVGGSVAYYVSVFAEELLTAALRDVLGGREVVLVRLALGGWKQPQQLMAVNWLLSLGAEFDAILNIDGFNEVALPWPENGARGVYPGYPRAWVVHTRGMPSSAERNVLSKALLANAERERWARLFMQSPIRLSVTAQAVWKIRDTTLVSKLAEAVRNTQRPPAYDLPFMTSGPGAPDAMTEEVYADLAANWRRSSSQIAQLCAANGIRYLHFLQANQYVPDSKPLGKIEAREAINPEHIYRDGVLRGYPYLISEGRTLRDSGVEFHDLTMIFADETAQMYLDDCCHYTEAGNRRFMNRVAEEVARSIRADENQ